MCPLLTVYTRSELVLHNSAERNHCPYDDDNDRIWKSRSYAFYWRIFSAEREGESVELLRAFVMAFHWQGHHIATQYIEMKCELTIVSTPAQKWVFLFLLLFRGLWQSCAKHLWLIRIHDFLVFGLMPCQWWESENRRTKTTTNKIHELAGIFMLLFDVVAFNSIRSQMERC